MDFSSIFREKMIQKLHKARRTAFCTKIDKEFIFGTFFLAKNSIFIPFGQSLWVPGGPGGRPRDVPEAFHFFINCQLLLKTGLDQALGGPRRPPGTSRAWFLVNFQHVFWINFHTQSFRDAISESIFDIFFESISIRSLSAMQLQSADLSD